jgi:hypothetical protein
MRWLQQAADADRKHTLSTNAALHAAHIVALVRAGTMAPSDAVADLADEVTELELQHITDENASFVCEAFRVMCDRLE